MESESVILQQKYKLLEKIGSGTFGSIYMCQHITTKIFYAAKIEKKGKGDGQLQYEIKLYQIFQGINGISKLHDYGLEGDRLFMIIDLLSYSLQDLFQLCGKKFTVHTAINIAIQIITRLEQIHRKGFVHRDIKANNFMVGKAEKIKVVYVIDFGLAKKYKDMKTGLHIPPKGGKSLVGTARYASIASHEGYEQCRRDDLQSLGYLLLYFVRGKLPWQGIQVANKVEKYQEIGKMKKTTSIESMCAPLGEPANIFVKYFDYVKSLTFEQEPNYDLLRKLLKQQILKKKSQNQGLDWEKLQLEKVQKEKIKSSKQ